MFLKKKFGAGYHLVIVKEEDCNVERITQRIAEYIPEVRVNQNVGAELSYLLPEDQSHQFQHIFKDLEVNQHQYGISSYGASVTTMEEVTVILNKAFLDQLGNISFLVQVFIKVGEVAVQAEELERQHSAVAVNNAPSQDLLELAADSQSRNGGVDLFIQQLGAMLVKKWTYVVRNWLLLTFQVILPILFVVIALVVLQSIPGD